MALNDVLGLSVDISAKTDGFVRSLQRAASSARLDLNVHKPLISSFKAAQSDIKGLFAKTVADAASTGFDKVRIKNIIGKFQPLTDEFEKSMKTIFKMEMALRKGTLSDEKKERVKALLDEEKTKLKGLDYRIKKEKLATDKIIKRRKDALQEAERLAARTFSEAGEEFGDSVSKTFDEIKSGNIGGLFKGAGKRVGGWGALMTQRASGMGGAGAGVMKGIGEFLTKMGPALLAIGAIAAGFAAVVGIILQADAAVKDLNKTLLSTGVSGADLANQYGKLGTTMNDISKGFMESFAFNRIWGTTAKDHIEILGAYAEAGLTFREMTQGVKSAGEQMEVLKQHTQTALTYSKLLGMSTSEISQTMATYMTDLGFTLEGVQSRFANITAAARESGFATKRFFNMVLQATTGMSMYNVRLEEAAALLIQLGNILGEKMGGDFLQQLTKGFKDEGTQDRIKKTMTTGVGYSLKVLQKDAVKTSEEFRRKMDDLGKTNVEARDELNAAISDAVGKDVSKMSPEDMVKSLSKLSSADQSKLLARAEASKNPAMVRMLGELMNKSTAFSGGLRGAQAARQFAGAGATLALQLNELRAVTGKSLADVDLRDMTQRMAWENLTGKSGEEALKLFEVGRRFSGRQRVIAEAQAGIRGAKTTDEAQALADAFNDKFGKEFGILMDSTGQRFKAQLGLRGGIDKEATFGVGAQRVGDTLEDILTSTGDELIGRESTRVAEDIVLAQEIASNTTEMSKVLEQGVEYFLAKIYQSVQYIASFFGAGLSEKQQEEVGKAKVLTQEQIDKTREQIKERSIAIQKAQTRLKQSSVSDDEKAELEGNLRTWAGDLETLQTKKAIQEAQLRGIDNIPEDVIDRVKEENLTPQMVQAMSSETPEVRDVLSRVYGGAEGKKKVRDARQAIAQGLPPTSTPVGVVPEGFLPSEERAQKLLANWEYGANTGQAVGGNGLFDLESYVSYGDVDVVGEMKSDALNLSKKEMTEEEKQKEKLVKDLLAGWKDIQGMEDAKKLAAQMFSLGVEGTPETLLAQADAFLKYGTIPRNIGDLGKEVPGRGRLGDILAGSPVATPQMAAAIAGKIGPGGFGWASPPANDFLMHIGADGNVKFAQRIDGSDTVALASKAGGAVSSAAGKAGKGGGVTIVQHNYSDMEAIKKGYRSLMAARAL